MLEVTERVRIPDDELEWSFVRAKRARGAERQQGRFQGRLRWRALATTAAISERAMSRMWAHFPSRFTANGDVLIQSQQYRDQERNREDCLGKLAAMIREIPRTPASQGDQTDQGFAAPPRSGQARQSAKKRDRRSSGSAD